MRDTKNNAMLCGSQLFLLAVAVCLVYADILDNQFVFDDSRIYNSPFLRITSLSWDSLSRVVLHGEPITRPVANLSFALNYFLHGYQVGGYHLVNLVIHLVNGILLYFLALTILRTPAIRPGKEGCESNDLTNHWMAFFAALLWLVHPLQTQSVAYTVQRMNSLAALFYLASLLLYIRGRGVVGGKRRWLLWSFGLLAALCAMGSKEIAVTLPLFVILFEWFFIQEMSLARLRRHLVAVIMVLMALAGIAVLFVGLHPIDFIASTYEGRTFTPVERLMTEPRVLFFYLSLFLLPLPSRLNLDHDFAVSSSLVEPLTTIPAMAGIAALAVIAVLAARKERLLSFAILWFLGNLAVESTIIGLELVFEHRMYLASMMLCIVSVVFIDRSIRWRLLKIAVLTGMALLLAFGSFERNRVWQDQITLWSDAAAKSPDKARPHNNLGVALRRAGRLDEAAGQYKRVIEIDPQFLEAYNNLANVLIQTGRFQEALDYFYRALEIDPRYAVIHNNVGRLMVRMGRYDRALMHFSEAVRLQPDNREARANMKEAYRLWEAGKGKL